MLSQPGHMGEGLGPAQDDLTDIEDPPWRALPSLRSREGMGTRLVNPTEIAGLSKGEHMDPRLMSGRPAWD